MKWANCLFVQLLGSCLSISSKPLESPWVELHWSEFSAKLGCFATSWVQIHHYYSNSEIRSNQSRGDPSGWPKYLTSDGPVILMMIGKPGNQVVGNQRCRARGKWGLWASLSVQLPMEQYNSATVQYCSSASANKLQVHIAQKQRRSKFHTGSTVHYCPSPMWDKLGTCALCTFFCTFQST